MTRPRRLAGIDAMLLRDFTRVRALGTAAFLEVKLVNWDAGTHSPNESWVEIERLSDATETGLIARHRRRLLHNRRFFRICQVCSERRPVGQMHNSRTCQGCAVRTLGIVY